jgi:replicative DNA helicase
MSFQGCLTNQENSLKVATLNNNQSLPPANPEAEEAVLGALLFDSNAIERVGESLQPESFSLVSHQHIYRACYDIWQAGTPINVITVAEWLERRKLLECVDGRAKLGQLMARTVTSVNIDSVAAIVAEKALSRLLLEIGQQISSLAHDPAPFQERLTLAQEKLFALQQGGKLTQKVEVAQEITIRVYEELDKIFNSGMPNTIKTGYYDLDNLVGGFTPGELVILGGRPSIGKSLIACSIAFEIACAYTEPVMIFSLEMTKESIIRRFISNIANVEGDKLKQGLFEPNDWSRIALAIDKIGSLPMLIDDTSCPSVHEIRSKVRTAIAQHKGLKLIVIDYLQLMADGSDTRLVQQLGEITRQLKLLAKDYNVPILLLSQLNRGVEGRLDKRPKMSDLRESGRIEEDADVVLLCYRDEYYNPDTFDKNVMEIGCTKNRNGATGTIKLLFEGRYSRLKNLKKG